MAILELLLCVAIGLLVSSIIWQIADQQIRDSLASLQPICLDCGASLPMTAWLPLLGGLNRVACLSCNSVDTQRRWWEIAVAGYFGLVAVALESWGDRAIAIIASLFLLLILAVDLKVQVVFVSDCYAAVFAGLGLALIEGPSTGVSALLGAGIAVGSTLVFLVISRWVLRSIHLSSSTIGRSDLYVAAAAGAVARSDAVLPMLVFAVVAVTLVATILPVIRTDARSRVIPFGPFLIVGALISQLL